MQIKVETRQEYYDILSTINRKYKCIDIESNNYYYIMDRIIDLAINSSDSDIEKVCAKRYKEYIGNSIQNGDTSFLNCYINNNICVSQNSHTNKRQIRKIYNLLNEFNCNLTIEVMIKLINENKIIRDILDNIYKDSDNENIYSVKIRFDNFLITMLEVYCEKNDLELNQNNNDIKSIDGNKNFLKSISKIKLLSKEETEQLFRQYQSGDMNARQKLIESNIRLVLSIAARMHSNSFDYLDLVDYGVIGLINAVERFDLSKNCRFSTYASWWIRQSISMAICEYENENHNKLDNIITKYKIYTTNYYSINNFYPSDDEIVKELKITNDTLNVIKLKIKGVTSLNDTLIDNDNNDTEIIETIVDKNVDIEQEIELKLLKEEIIDLFSKAGLTYNEMYVIINRYGLINDEVKTYDEMREFLNCSRENVRLTINKALNKMKKCSYSLKFINYMDNPKKIMNDYNTLINSNKKTFKKKYKNKESLNLSIEDDPFLKSDYIEILNYVLQMPISEITSIFDDKELSFIYLQTNYLNNKRHSISELSQILFLDEKSILEYFKNILLKTSKYLSDNYNEDINKKISNSLLQLAKIKK